LKTDWHRNRDKTWTANDMYDIDAMALAVPYCDIVVTEKACHHTLPIARLGERMDTALLRNLEEIQKIIEKWNTGYKSRHGGVAVRIIAPTKRAETPRQSVTNPSGVNNRRTVLVIEKEQLTKVLQPRLFGNQLREVAVKGPLRVEQQ
jgi:endonuclease/exonuclease/phosphatase family metal-dependent hydrolase